MVNNVELSAWHMIYLFEEGNAMEIKNGLVYQNNYERAVSAFVGTFGEEPADEAGAEAYQTLLNMYDVLATRPECLGIKAKEDVSFIPWEKQKGREKDVQAIRGAGKKVQELMSEFQSLLQTGKVCEQGIQLGNESVLPKRTLMKLLDAVNITIDSDKIMCMTKSCATGLKRLAEQDFSLFCRGLEQLDEGRWLEKDFDQFLNADGVLLWLCDELEKRGYEKLHRIDGKRISLDYVKEYGNKKHPVKMTWGDKFHAGIEVSYEDIMIEPCYVWLRVPQFDEVLKRNSELSEHTKEFFHQHIKQCNGCRYCVQTDKTGKRPLAAVEVMKAKLCPMLPGFSMNWRDLPKKRAEKMLMVLDDVEQLFS